MSIRFHFPPSFPVASKLLEVDLADTPAKAIKFVAERLKFPIATNGIALRIPDETLNKNVPCVVAFKKGVSVSEKRGRVWFSDRDCGLGHVAVLGHEEVSLGVLSRYIGADAIRGLCVQVRAREGGVAQESHRYDLDTILRVNTRVCGCVVSV